MDDRGDRCLKSTTLHHTQGHRKVWKFGGQVSSNVLGVTWPQAIEIEVMHLPKSGLEEIQIVFISFSP